MFIFNILCSNGTLEVIDERTNILGKCFLDTCLLVPFYSIFATVNVYILASENNLSRKVNDFNINSMRILTFLLFFVSLIEIFMKYFWISKLVDSESVMLVSDLYLFISLGIHFFVVLNKNIFCFFPKNFRDSVVEPDLLLNDEYIKNLASDYSIDVSIPLEEQNDQMKKGLLKALISNFGIEFLCLGVLKFINDVLSFSGPLLLNLLVKFVETKNESLRTGCIYAIGLFFFSFINSLISIHFTISMSKLTFRIRTVIVHVIYYKALLVKLSELNKYSIGQITNFMSIDTDSLVNAFPSFHAFWSLPLQITVALYLLYTQVGISFIVGVLFILILIPINKYLSDFIGRVQTKLMYFKDKRVKSITEFLQGIRAIKFYSWEKYFLGKIKTVREKELAQLRTKKYLDAGCVYFWACSPILISVATFITYALLGNQLTPSKVFTSLALFNMLISPLNSFPWVINGLVQAWVSLKRIQGFLDLKNINWFSYYSFNQLNVINIRPSLDFDIKGGQFFWEKDTMNSENFSRPKIVLNKIDLKVKKGQLIGIIGKVGSGKTTLLHAIMNEIEKNSGKIRINSELCSKGFSYVAQESWIRAGTIKENILFESIMDENLYKKVIEACALVPDLNMLPKGDETYVGENGLNLSGGQRARICLARACYANTKDVYLLDDPFSAVDNHVGRHISNHCINKLLYHKTRIICTHHYKYLKNADLIIIIDSHGNVRSGLYNEILESYMNDENKKRENEELNSVETSAQNREHIIEQLTALNIEREKKNDDEEKEDGYIDLTVYKKYCLAVGIFLTILTLSSLFFMQTSKNLTDLWLSYWIEHHNSLNSTSYNKGYVTAFQNEDTRFFYLVYGCLCLGNSIFTLLRSVIFAYSGIIACRFIHECLITNISKANLNFFQNTPSGRILNRFSSDMYAIDDSLPFILNIFLANLFGLIGMLTVTCYSLPWFTLSLIPLGIVYYSIQNYYRWSSRELKRLSSIALSPLYTHFHETLTGLTTIRAFRKVKIFINLNEMYLNDYIQATYVNMAASQWLNFRLQMISVIMITIVGFTAVFQHIYSTANASLIGLALSYILNVTGLLNGLLSSFTETEKEMISIERVNQFEKIEQENLDCFETVTNDWLETPSIEFIQSTLKYDKNDVNALDNISFSIKSGENIGICGRTGSGKSSLFNALFRGAELNSGSIQISGKNISSIKLSDLRKKLMIIPQETFIFDGTIRENLDPMGLKSDKDLWDSLEKCQLAEKFKTSSSLGLDERFLEKGQNLSIGEKQLVCLARALLTDCKILCIDEATASIDLQMDNVIQEIIKKEFKDTTILTIAHRIQTISDYDRILVMNKGQVAEFDSPKILLSNQNSLFFKLVKDYDH